MDKEQRIQRAFKLVEAFISGYASHQGVRPTGLAIGAWVRLFENCYKGIDEMLEKANEFDFPDNPKITVL